MNRNEVLEAVRDVVKRTGKVPGRRHFENETGIGRHEWYGRYWARWGDVLTEAGYPPNSLNLAADKEAILDKYLAYVVELARVPTEGELRVRRHADKSFPGHGAIRSTLGGQKQRLDALLRYAERTEAPPAIQSLLRNTAAALPEVSEDLVSSASANPKLDGYVYLMKSGRNFKIGHTNSLDRRQYEIGLQLPDKLEPVHSIATDDPSGIEAYWHNRFSSRRLNGEWFKLTSDDVRSFKRRKFM